MKLADAYRMLAKDLDYAVENLIRADAPYVLVQEIAELATHMHRRARGRGQAGEAK